MNLTKRQISVIASRIVKKREKEYYDALNKIRKSPEIQKKSKEISKRIAEFKDAISTEFPIKVYVCVLMAEDRDYSSSVNDIADELARKEIKKSGLKERHYYKEIEDDLELACIDAETLAELGKKFGIKV